MGTNEASGTIPRLSVIICTYNRARLLVGALESLSLQTADDDEFEIIVVDNNSDLTNLEAQADVVWQAPQDRVREGMA